MLAKAGSPGFGLSFAGSLSARVTASRQVEPVARHDRARVRRASRDRARSARSRSPPDRRPAHRRSRASRRAAGCAARASRPPLMRERCLRTVLISPMSAPERNSARVTACFSANVIPAGAIQLAEAPPDISTSTRSSAVALAASSSARAAESSPAASGIGCPASIIGDDTRRAAVAVARDRDAGDAVRRKFRRVEIMLLGDLDHRARRLAGGEQDQPAGRRRLRQMRGRQVAGCAAATAVRTALREMRAPSVGPIMRPVSSAAARGRATQMPNRMSTPPSACTSPSGSPSSSQPKERGRDRLEEDHQRGECRRQRAERDRHQPLAADLADQRERDQRADAGQRLRQDARLEHERDDEQAGGRDRGRDEHQLGGAVPRAPRTHRQHVGSRRTTPSQYRRDRPSGAAARSRSFRRSARSRRAMQSASPISVRAPTASTRTSHAPSATQIGAVVARKVAFATVVPRIARCQKNRSPVKNSPASSTARSSAAGAARRASPAASRPTGTAARETRARMRSHKARHRPSARTAPRRPSRPRRTTSAADRDREAAFFLGRDPGSLHAANQRPDCIDVPRMTPPVPVALTPSRNCPGASTSMALEKACASRGKCQVKRRGGSCTRRSPSSARGPRACSCRICSIARASTASCSKRAAAPMWRTACAPACWSRAPST